MKIGDRVKIRSDRLQEKGTIVRKSEHASYDWDVEIDGFKVIESYRENQLELINAAQ